MDTGDQGRSGEMGRPDHVSRFEVEVAGADLTSPEDWARMLFEGLPRAIQVILTLGWRRGLGLRLAPRGTSGHVLGWRVGASGADSVALEAEGASLGARNVIAVDPASVSWTTEVHYRRPAGRILWNAALPMHRLTGPLLLGRAVRARRHPR